MWNRAELKGKAKFSFKRNYWKSVLISLLLALIVGGGGTGASSAASSFRSGMDNGYHSSQDSDYSDIYDYDEYDYDDYDHYDDYDDYDDYEGSINDFKQGFKEGMSDYSPVGWMATLAIFGITFIIIFILIMTAVILIDVFICNPVEVGCKRYFLRNLNEKAQVGNIGYAFDNNYKNITKTMFFRDLYTVLWTLLLIIPGIVKSYEYQMIPYLLAENPQMTKEQAFAESKRMMTGQKWRAFVLDLSFIGWNILSALTLGILGIFYVQPYMDATHAALYEALRYGNPYGAPNYFNGMPGGYNGESNGFNGMSGSFNGESNGFNGMPGGYNGESNGSNGMSDSIVEDVPRQ